MCGIAGIRRYGNKPISEEMMSLLLVGNEHRGNDATGIAIQQADGKIDVCKGDSPAWKFVAAQAYLDFIKKYLKNDSIGVLLHTRAATKGLPRDNNNNHPMYAGCAAIIHNGVLRNDDTMFSQLKLDRKAETDSDIIRAIIDRDGFTEEAAKNLSKLAGSGAGAAFHPKYPGKMLIFRSGNPMTLCSNDDFFIFASEKNTLHKATRPWVKRFGIWYQASTPNVDFSLMPDDTVWIMGEKELEAHWPCKILSGTYVEPCRKTYDEYEERNRRWDAEAANRGKVKVTAVHQPVSAMINPTTQAKSITKQFAWCEKCRRDWVIPADADPTKYICNPKDAKPGCGERLMALPKRARVN